MRTVIKMLIALGATAALSGCEVVPVGRPHAYVYAPAPVVVVHGYYR